MGLAMNAGPEWIYLKQQFIRRLQMSDKNFLGALTCSTFLLVLTMHTAHTAHLCSGHQMHRLLIWDQQRGTRHLLCPPSPMPPSQLQPSRRENISRLFVENILKIRQRYVTPKVILFSLAHLELSESWNVLISRIFQQPSSLGRYYHHQASKPNHPKDY